MSQDHTPTGCMCACESSEFFNEIGVRQAVKTVPSYSHRVEAPRRSRRP
jgi:hypothetical protein